MSQTTVTVEIDVKCHIQLPHWTRASGRCSLFASKNHRDTMCLKSKNGILERPFLDELPMHFKPLLILITTNSLAVTVSPESCQSNAWMAN